MERYAAGSYEVRIKGTVGVEAKLSQEVALSLILENPCPDSKLTQLAQKLAGKTTTDNFGSYLYELGAKSIDLAF